MNILIVNCCPVRDGATAAICAMAADALASQTVKSVCIDDYDIALCRGCRKCHTTAKCVMEDGAQRLMAEFEAADTVLCVAPSYWADVPGQFKAFIDRCTPWCNTHEPHASLTPGKKGYVIALRTGPNVPECEKIVGTLNHFYGHLEMEQAGHLCLTKVEYKADAEARKDEIAAFCETLLG